MRAPPIHLAVLTGAGISAESGISTFRGQNGLWEGHAIEEVASPEGFAADPELVYQFYNLRRAQLHEVEPNPAHQALARLAQADGVRLTLVTQNVDDLHERAGSPEVFHMHGEIRKARCVACERVVSHPGDLGRDDRCGDCGKPMRPHIVWFGEMPLQMDRISERLTTADLFLAIGTSGLVYPASGFVGLMKERGCPTLEFNLGRTAASALFDESITGKASQTLPHWTDRFLADLQWRGG